MEWLSSLGTFGTIVRGIIVLFEAICVLNLMILVHEWGHFLAARWRGLKVEKFYIWFGKPIWKRTYNGVEYGLGCIPLGGFVALPQMAPMGGAEGEVTSTESLPPISPLDKIIVAFAGPLFSFLLAVVFAFIVCGVGMPDRRIHTTIIGWVAPDMPAAIAGFKPGDEIVAVDGVEVHSWDEPIDSVIERIAFSKGDTIVFTVKRPGEEQTLDIPTGFKVAPGTLFERKGLRKVGLLWSYPAQVYDVIKGSAAERAGLQKGDVVTHMNDVAVYGPNSVYDAIAKNAPVKLAVKRGVETMTINITALAPEKPKDIPKEVQGVAASGILFEDPSVAKEMGLVHPQPSDQIAKASIMMFRTFGALFSSKGDIGVQQMGSPVKIISTYTQLFQIPDGWRLVLWFSVILNVNLAIMNLFPFPVFDGGHIVMGLSEMFRRKPLLPQRAMEIVMNACVLLLLCFFVYIAWFDVNDLVGKKATPEETFKIEDLVYPAAK
ncbi:MAG: RIP metalloprotease RseP [Verrucomicrobiaceae bacterium]